MRLIKGTSQAKVILTGEHSVVYGHRAVSQVVPLYLTATVADAGKSTLASSQLINHIFEIFYQAFPQATKAVPLSIDSQIPVGSGLGSSAAVAHAIVKALVKFHILSLTKKQIFELVQKSEVAAHGNPSGLDAMTVVTESPLIFKKTTEGFEFESLKTTAFKNKKFFLIQSGIPKESTKDMVGLVKSRLADKPRKIESALNAMGQVTELIIKDLQQNSFNSSLLTQNQIHLETLGVVGQQAKNMIKAIQISGGHGKITGAGGVATGSGMILATHDDTDKLQHLITTKDWEAYSLTFS